MLACVVSCRAGGYSDKSKTHCEHDAAVGEPSWIARSGLTALKSEALTWTTGEEGTEASEACGLRFPHGAPCQGAISFSCLISKPRAIRTRHAVPSHTELPANSFSLAALPATAGLMLRGRSIVCLGIVLSLHSRSCACCAAL